MNQLHQNCVRAKFERRLTYIERRVERRIAKETARSALEYDFPKLAQATGEQITLLDNPPTIYHCEGGRPKGI